ncbi:hypothetical protein GCM10023405_48320 [Streptomonospora salina]
MTPTAMITNSHSTQRNVILISMRVKSDIELLFSPCRASARWRSSEPPPRLIGVGPYEIVSEKPNELNGKGS